MDLNIFPEAYRQHPVFYYKIDMDGCIREVEGEHGGLDPIHYKDLVGRSVFELFRPRTDMLSAIRRALQGQKVRQSEETDGRRFDTCFIPEFDENNSQRGVLGIEIELPDEPIEISNAISMSEQRRMHLDNIPLAVIEFDGNFRVRRWSPLCEQYFRVAAEDAKGKNLVEIGLIPETLQRDYLAVIQELVEGRRKNFNFHKLRSSEGDVMHIEWFNSIIRDRKGRIVSIMSMLQDISHHVRLRSSMEKEIARRNYELSHTQNSYKEFIDTSSGALKEPVKQIRAFLDLLAGNIKSDGDKHYNMKVIDFVLNSVDRIDDMVDWMYQFSRAGSKPLQPTQLNLRRSINRIYEQLQYDNIEREISLRVGEMPPVTADKELMEHLFRNLLTNSLTLTRDNDFVFIEINYIEDKENHIFLLRDNGVGYKADLNADPLNMIQLLTEQGELDNVGFGLAYAKRVVTRHGGHINHKICEEEGSVLYFNIPKRLFA